MERRPAMPDPELAIGIFDSGVGGLTVHRRVAELLPNESIIYLGDTARVPYGTKSADTVIRYARACARVLLDRGIKMLVVACNTASAYALDTLERELEVPVLGVITPGAVAAVQRSQSGRIGVIGTPGTIASHTYPDAIVARRPGAAVFCAACPLFVPLAEEGWTEGAVPSEVAHTYLAGLLAHRIDTLVLGCTHYPLLSATIGEVAGPDVVLVDSACETARVVAETLRNTGLARKRTTPPNRQFLVSDAPEGFTRISRRFLGEEVSGVEWVDC